MPEQVAVATQSTETPTAESRGESVAVSAETRNAKFADALRAEFRERDEEIGNPTDNEPHVAATGSKTEPAKRTPGKKTLDDDEVLDLLRAGSFEELAEKLGADKREFRPGKSRWAKFKFDTKKSHRELTAQREEIERSRAQLKQTIDTVNREHQTLIKAADLLKNGDKIGFIEAAFGRKWEDIQREIVDDALDPSAQKVRRLEQEREQEKREAAKRETERQAAEAKREQDAKLARYREDLKEDLIEDESLGLKAFEKDPKFNEFANAVMQMQIESLNKGEELSTRRAAKRVIRKLQSEYDAWGKWLNAQPSTGTTQNKPDQSTRGARASATGPINRSQSGAGAPSRPLSREELNRQFARQLRAEFANGKH